MTNGVKSRTANKKSYKETESDKHKERYKTVNKNEEKLKK